MELFRCVAYRSTMQEEWDRLAITKGTIFHSTAFRQILLESFGYHCAYQAILDQQDQICALLPLIAGRNLGLKSVAVAMPFVNYVDICADSEAARRFALESLPALREQYHFNYLELRLKTQNWDSPGWTSNLENYTFVLPLSADEEQVLSLSTPSNRNHVRKVYRNNWFTVSFDPGHLDAFYQVYCKRMKQLGSPAPDIGFFKRFFDYLPDQAYLLSVLDRETEQVVGGMLLLTSPGDQTLYYPYGANLVEYNNKYLNNFMYWEAVRFGIRQKLNYLDLGRSQIGAGTYTYKEQWGAAAEQLNYLVYSGGQASAGPPDRKKLSVFVGLWKAAPAFITDTVGKHLIPYVLP
ncbi:MAG: hypothetical protein K0Q77_732 [Anaerosporomusa subterranea]|nr:hypothetical protein [Anaerosporomusa subterranea]